jgi:RNA polymerase sigma factor (TIGR02999 family)
MAWWGEAMSIYAPFSCRRLVYNKEKNALEMSYLVPGRDPINTSSSHEVTQLLVAWSDGDQAALEQLTPLVYSELHRLAVGYMRREHPGHLLQTTALVNEAYLRLIYWKDVRWQNRAHFFGVAAQLMRRILVDFARARRQDKRGDAMRQVSFDEAEATPVEQTAEIIALDEALERLAAIDPRRSRMVELRFFGGLSEEEKAEALKVSPHTVRREWGLARAWLRRELRKGEQDEA